MLNQPLPQGTRYLFQNAHPDSVWSDGWCPLGLAWGYPPGVAFHTYFSLRSSFLSCGIDPLLSDVGLWRVMALCYLSRLSKFYMWVLLAGRTVGGGPFIGLMKRVGGRFLPSFTGIHAFMNHPENLARSHN